MGRRVRAVRDLPRRHPGRRLDENEAVASGAVVLDFALGGPATAVGALGVGSAPPAAGTPPARRLRR